MRYVSIVLACVVASTARAQMISSSAQTAKPGAVVAAGVFANSSTEYDIEDYTTNPDINRTMLGVELGYGIAPLTDLFFQAAFINDSEFDGVNDANGDGFMVGGGARLEVLKQNNITASAYGLLLWQKERFRGEKPYKDLKVETELYELRGGGVATIAMTPIFSPYLGIDISPISQGEFEAEIDDEKDTLDLEREYTLGLHIGGDLELGSVHLRGSIITGGEDTFILAISPARTDKRPVDLTGI